MKKGFSQNKNVKRNTQRWLGTTNKTKKKAEKKAVPFKAKKGKAPTPRSPNFDSTAGFGLPIGQADEVMNTTSRGAVWGTGIAGLPEQALSPGMKELLYPAKERKIMIVKTPEGSIKNRQEFIDQLGLLNVQVIFLEYTTHLPRPEVEMFQR